MTILNTSRIAGPFLGNGATRDFPFSFKVFDPADLLVTIAGPTGISSTLTLGIDYTVILNTDQNNNPGGVVRATLAPPSGYRLSFTTDLQIVQKTDLTNQGGFYPNVINNALDRLTINLQQLADSVRRSLRFGFSDANAPQLPSAQQRANGLLGFDESGNPLIVGLAKAPERAIQRELQIAAAGQTVFNLAQIRYTPGIASLQVHVDGLRVYGADYIEATSAQVVFNIPLREGAEVLFEAGSAVNSQSSSEASMITFRAGGTGAVPTSADAKFRQIIDAADFGFSVPGSPEGNRDAIYNAVVFADGREVRVTANRDFEMSRLDLNDMPVDLVFLGGGRVLRTSGSSGVLNIVTTYTNIEPITAIDPVTYVVDGNAGGRATRVSVANSSFYARGDVVRVVSDDLDTTADASDTTELIRRVGEFGSVIGVEPGYIYLSNVLEDLPLYTTNPRIARMPKRKYSVRGLRCLSHFGHTSQLIGLVALYKPYFEFEVENHGQIGVNISGAYLGEFYLRGSGKGNSDGSLGYLGNDTSGWGNKFIRPHGKYWRHVLTTGQNETTVNDARIHLYGGTREHTVLDGTAEACQGAPWDEHPGARRTQWINCSAYASIRNTATSHTAFQARGRDCVVTNPTVDKSFAAVMRLGTVAIGSVTITGGRAACLPFDIRTTAETINHLTLRVINFNCTVDSVQSFFTDLDCDVFITGGTYTITKLTHSSAQFLSAAPKSRYFLDNPVFHVARHPTTPGTGFRCLRTAAGTGDALITGRCMMGSDGTTTGMGQVFRSDNPDSRLIVKALWIKGTIPTITFGTFNTLKYSVNNIVTPASSATNVATLDDYIKTLGAL